MERELINVSEAARLLGLTRPTFYNRLKDNTIKHAMLISGRPVFYRDEIEQLAKTAEARQVA